MSLDEDLISAVKARNEAKERYEHARASALKDYENAGKRIAEILQMKYGAEGVTVEKLR